MAPDHTDADRKGVHSGAHDAAVGESDARAPAPRSVLLHTHCAHILVPVPPAPQNLAVPKKDGDTGPPCQHKAVLAQRAGRGGGGMSSLRQNRTIKETAAPNTTHRAARTR